MLDLDFFKLDGFSELIDSGQVKEHQIDGLFSSETYFIVVEKLTTTVTDLFERNDMYFKKIDILKLGIQLVKKIRKLHEIGYVHLDLKPDNFMFNNSENAFFNINNNPVLSHKIELGDHLLRKLQQDKIPVQRGLQR